ncbi:MAG: hypothetical protein R2865_03505 [Deinococcales bacterium]
MLILAIANVPENYNPVYLSAGIGVQINIALGSFLLPPLRFDYGFSERHPQASLVSAWAMSIKL